MRGVGLKDTEMNSNPAFKTPIRQDRSHLTVVRINNLVSTMTSRKREKKVTYKVGGKYNCACGKDGETRILLKRYILTLEGPATIVYTRENDGVTEYYVHFINCM